VLRLSLLHRLRPFLPLSASCSEGPFFSMEDVNLPLSPKVGVPSRLPTFFTSKSILLDLEFLRFGFGFSVPFRRLPHFFLSVLIVFYSISFSGVPSIRSLFFLYSKPVVSEKPLRPAPPVTLTSVPPVLPLLDRFSSSSLSSVSPLPTHFFPSLDPARLSLKPLRSLFHVPKLLVRSFHVWAGRPFRFRRILLTTFVPSKNSSPPPRFSLRLTFLPAVDVTFYLLSSRDTLGLHAVWNSSFSPRHLSRPDAHFFRVSEPSPPFFPSTAAFPPLHRLHAAFIPSPSAPLANFLPPRLTPPATVRFS